MPSVAHALEPLVERLLEGRPLPIRVVAWDGSALGPPDARTTIVIRRPDALRRLIYAPGELGLTRAYVAGDLDIEGDVYGIFAVRDLIASPHEELSIGPRGAARLAAFRAASQLGALGRPLPPPPEEARLRGRLHSIRRDAQAVSHHYDVSNDFYRLVLGESMTYSCAYFPDPDMSLTDAQTAKHDLIARKLGLRSGMRLLDVGCGWGGMVIHAAAVYGVSAVGITLSRAQADSAAKRVADAGVADRVEIRLQDYREVSDGPYDAISSIGMFEHVGGAQRDRYFAVLRRLLVPTGRLLNHAISRPGGRRAGFDRDSFIARYVFPDGELQEVGGVVSSMQRHGFEVRDVESLREHYAQTLRRWVANLERHWDEAVGLVGAARARIWRLYMAGSAVGFEAGRINIHQVLGIVAGPRGESGMPRTRAGFNR